MLAGPPPKTERKKSHANVLWAPGVKYAWTLCMAKLGTPSRGKPQGVNWRWFLAKYIIWSIVGMQFPVFWSWNSPIARYLLSFFFPQSQFSCITTHMPLTVSLAERSPRSTSLVNGKWVTKWIGVSFCIHLRRVSPWAVMLCFWGFNFKSDSYPFFVPISKSLDLSFFFFLSSDSLTWSHFPMQGHPPHAVRMAAHAHRCFCFWWPWNKRSWVQNMPLEWYDYLCASINLHPKFRWKLLMRQKKFWPVCAGVFFVQICGKIYFFICGRLHPMGCVDWMVPPPQMRVSHASNYFWSRGRRLLLAPGGFGVNFVVSSKVF